MTEMKMQLVDWLDDLCVRFLVNLPQEELQEPERICFQIEEAQWFYEDFVRPLDPTLPQLNLSEFASRILRHCPLTAGYSDHLHEQAFKSFLTYKTRVPVRGAILLDEDMDKILLVKGYKKNATWSFPRGKINKNEDDLVCAVREVWEETGYDVDGAGLIPEDRHVHHIDVTMREQHLRMFVFRNVPLDTHFEPQTRKEISKIQWYKLDSLPTYNNNNNKRRANYATDPAVDATPLTANKLYMVAPFLPALRKWINQQKKRDAQRLSQLGRLPRDSGNVFSDAPLDPGRQSQPHHVDLAADAADELKQLLSLNPATQQPNSIPTPSAAVDQNTPPAGMLLAMLRASVPSVPSPAAQILPVTPMEQLMYTPQEPQSPHVHHVKSSPKVVQQPPPQFPFAQNGQNVQDPTRPMPFGAMVAPLDQPHPWQTQHALPPQYGQSQPMLQNMNQQFHQTQSQSQSEAQAQMMAALQPQGRGAIAHGPPAPKASQLPPPNMNSHAMNLLNAFKTPSASQQQSTPRQMQQQPHYSMQQNLQPPGYPNGNMHLQQGPNHNMPPQQDLREVGSLQPGPPRSTHQNSLLDLFKSPVAQKATPATQQPDQGQHSTKPLQATQTAQVPQPVQASPLEQTHRRSVTMAMMTRTLPKTKAQSPPKSSPLAGGNGLFPANQVHMISSLENQAPEVQSPAISHGANTPPVTIMRKNGSSSRSAAATGNSSMSPSSPASTPRKGRSHKAFEQTTGPNFTILQRPSSNKPSESPKHQQTAATAQANEGTKPFQPQLLRRPKTEEAGPANIPPPNQPASPAKNGSDQRDTLLALFAKSGQGRKPAEVVAARAEPLSSGSSSPLPADPVVFRSRIASSTSVISNGDGVKSPSTPVEAKGFLLDYLNGVVKGEQQKGARRPQF